MSEENSSSISAVLDEKYNGVCRQLETKDRQLNDLREYINRLASELRRKEVEIKELRISCREAKWAHGRPEPRKSEPSVAEQLAESRIPVLQDRAEYITAYGIEAHTPGYVYLFSTADGLHKVGKSANPLKRLTDFKQKDDSTKIRLVIQTLNHTKLESRLHERFADRRQGGEWFKLSELDIALLAGEFC